MCIASSGTETNLVCYLLQPNCPMSTILPSVYLSVTSSSVDITGHQYMPSLESEGFHCSQLKTVLNSSIFRRAFCFRRRHLWWRQWRWVFKWYKWDLLWSSLHLISGLRWSSKLWGPIGLVSQGYSAVLKWALNVWGTSSDGLNVHGYLKLSYPFKTWIFITKTW